MTFEELHEHGCLKNLPMRAWLKATGTTSPSSSTPAWIVEVRWKVAGEQPLFVRVSLQPLELDGVTCCALVGRAISPGEGSPRGEVERAVVYLLSLAEPSVWLAIDSWMHVGHVSARTGQCCMQGPSVSESAQAVLKARDVEGEEFESDMLAGGIVKLLEAGQLEAEVAKQLDIQVPLTCTVVETPMMLKSLQPVDPEMWREHVEHYWSKGLNEDVWS